MTYSALSEAVGVENDTIIKDEYILAADHKNHDYDRKGRLNFPLGSWSTYGRQKSLFLEISIGRQLSIITAVATQGSGHSQEWVKTYTLRYSSWGDEWMVYVEDGEAKVRGD